MESLLEEIKRMNRLMLPYLKPETYEELMIITHNIIALFSKSDDKQIQSKLQNIIDSIEEQSSFKMKFFDAQSKIQTMECDMLLLRRELEIIQNIKH